MKDAAPPEIRPLAADALDEVVRIHKMGMGHTLNAQLGDDHLRYLYTMMASDPACYIGVAYVDGRGAGSISGSVDAAEFASRLMRTAPLGRMARTGAKMLVHPRLFKLWVQSNFIARPVRVPSGEVRAVLTAIVVDPTSQGRGVGRALVAAFEEFLRERRVPVYRLDTEETNARAAKFYQKLGFQEMARRSGSIIFVRDIPT